MKFDGWILYLVLNYVVVIVNQYNVSEYDNVGLFWYYWLNLDL